ncbi:MAG: radical SAM protein [Deltaproteobacteria bacterium]|nr:radical SAM protein [Deltaproteobacteria bacterium]
MPSDPHAVGSHDRPIASFDLTGACTQQCRHCYFSALSPSQINRRLARRKFLSRLRRLIARHGTHTALWAGGEPMLRLGLLRAVLPLFARNAISTSGMHPIPTDLGAGLLVSLDGLSSEHDLLRGSGAFGNVRRHLAALSSQRYTISTTLTLPTLCSIELLPRLIEATRAQGALVGFYVGRASSPFAIPADLRSRAVDRLHAVSERYAGAILNSELGLELLRPSHAKELSAHCLYRRTAVAFDPLLEQRLPCVFGSQANCGACGSPLVAEQRAKELGSVASERVVNALFEAG